MESQEKKTPQSALKLWQFEHTIHVLKCNFIIFSEPTQLLQYQWPRVAVQNTDHKNAHWYWQMLPKEKIQPLLPSFLYKLQDSVRDTQIILIYPPLKFIFLSSTNFWITEEHSW